MSQRVYCNVLYFVPEDGESEKSMNIFLIPSDPRTVTLREVREEFPLPGDYHFRFQYAFKTPECKVWIDLCSEDQHVPQVDGEIRMKVTRTSWIKDSTEPHRHQATQKQIAFQELVLSNYDAT